jgi:AraC-like DNA-binding protein/fumarate reductase subunit D
MRILNPLTFAPMELQSLYGVLFLLSLAIIAKQLLRKDKALKHLLFAAFAASLVLVALNFLLAPHIGAYRHLLAVGTSATCTSFLFLSRALFRNNQAHSLSMILLASVVILCLASNETLKFISAVILSGKSFGLIHEAFSSLVATAGSGVLVLTLWEACREFHKSDKAGKLQRVVFLSTYGGAVLLTTALGVNTELYPWLVAISALSILISTQVIIYWQDKAKDAASNDLPEKPIIEEDQKLVEELKRELYAERCYLKANLKLADLAQILQEPEYKISRALRTQFDAKNFNQFINHLRIEHAMRLLEDPAHDKWPVLTIGLKAGFASVGPFTRAFKNQHGCTPGEYRQNLQNLAAAS